MKIIIPLLFCALNLNWTMNQNMKNWETKTVNGKIETIKIENQNCLKFSTTGAKKSFVAINRKVDDVKIGDKIEVIAEVKANTSRAKLVVTGGFKWGEKNNNGQLIAKNYGANYVWTKLKVALQVKKLPLYVNLGIYKAKNKYLLVKNISVKPFVGKITSGSGLKIKSINYPDSLPGKNWEKVITGNKGQVSKINKGIRLDADTADAWVALRQKHYDFAVGEEIIFTAEVKAPTENAQLVITDGFTWGEAVNGHVYHKTKHSGSGEWEKLQAHLKVSSKLVCLGIGMSRGAPNQWLEARNIKITRERDIIPAKAKFALEQLKRCIKNDKYPSLVRNYCKKLAIDLEKNFSTFKNSNNKNLVANLKKLRKSLIAADSPLFTIEDKYINPRNVSLDDSKSLNMKVYNISSPHSIFMKIYTPHAKIWELDKYRKIKFGLLEGNLFQVTSSCPTNLKISTKKEGLCRLLPLNHRNKMSFREFNIK